MWARTSSNFIRTQGLRLGTVSTCSRPLESVRKCAQHKSADADSSTNTCLRHKKLCYTIRLPPTTFSLVVRYISSHDEGFSELDDTEASNSDDDSEIYCELDPSNEDGVGWSTSGSELKLVTERSFFGGQSSHKKWTSFDLSGVLLNEPKYVRTALDKYLSEDKTLDSSDISYAMITLLKNRMYHKALQFSEWLEEKKLLVFNEQHYASRINLIAKVQGLRKAECYIKSIPESFRGEVAYRSLLTHYVSSNNLKKAENLFDQMKQSRFAISAYTCNQMILIYKKQFNKKQIADMLRYMEKENVKPTLLTYKLLIDTKDVSGDIPGIEDIIETMKAEGIEPDLSTTMTIAKHYVAIGLKEKALSVIKGSNLVYTNPLPRAMILAISVFASLGKIDEVERIWKVCEREPHCNGWLAVISAYGKLKQIDKAEAVFEKLAKTTKLSTIHYSAMIRVYADNKMSNKAKGLMRRMGETGVRIDPYVSDALVRLYLEAGEIEEAEAVLEKAARGRDDVTKPMYRSYFCVMQKYAERGDVHNSEKMLLWLRQAGYSHRIRTFETLLQAYLNSDSPAYGFRERMMADNIFPDKAMKILLSRADPFEEEEIVPEMLD